MFETELFGQLIIAPKNGHESYRTNNIDSHQYRIKINHINTNVNLYVYTVALHSVGKEYRDMAALTLKVRNTRKMSHALPRLAASPSSFKRMYALCSSPRYREAQRSDSAVLTIKTALIADIHSV